VTVQSLYWRDKESASVGWLMGGEHS